MTLATSPLAGLKLTRKQRLRIADLLEAQMKREEREKDIYRLIDEKKLRIQTKTAELVPMELNSVQRKVDAVIRKKLSENKPVRVIILKPRQTGISTYIEALLYSRAASLANRNALILADEEKHAARLYGMSTRFQENMERFHKDEAPRLDTLNARGLKFSGKDSQILIGSAENPELSRSYTWMDCHLSEAAYFPPNRAQALMDGFWPSVSKAPSSLVILESTANGHDPVFYPLWKAAIEGKNDFTAIFIAWYEMDEYALPLTNEQFYPLDAINYDTEGGVADFLREEGELGEQIKRHYPGITEQAVQEKLNWRRYIIVNEFSGEVGRFRQEYPACVTAETLVSTDIGIIPIVEAHKAKETESGAIRACGPITTEKIFKLTTQSGRVLRGTKDHPIETPSGDFVWLSKLTQGQRIKLRPPMFSKEQFKLAWSPKSMSGKEIPGVTHFVHITSEWARFIGYFMGDGSWHNGSVSVVCDAKDQDIVSDVSSLFENLLGGFTTRNISRVQGRKGATEVRAGCIAARDAFEKLGLIKAISGNGNRMRHVHVPESIFRSPKPLVKEFLSALFECDGNVQDGRIRWGSSKLSFAREVQLLLLGFGINATLRAMHKRGGADHKYTYTFWEMSLDRCNSIRFFEEIGFIGARKKSGFKPLRESGRPANPIEMIDEVCTVEPDGEEMTYDLTVEPSHVFSANGISTHNTWMEAFQVSGSCVFRVSVLKGQMAQAEQRKPLIGKLFELGGKVEFREDPQGWLRLYQESDGRPVRIGGDTCEGLSWGEESALVAGDALTRDVLACVSGNYPPDILAKYAALLGKYYTKLDGLDSPLIAIEANGFGHTANAVLRGLYGNIYSTTEFDPDLKQEQRRYGFLTTSSSRDQLIELGKANVRENASHLRDIRLIGQLQTFVRNAKTGKVDHAHGAFSDLVFAWMIMLWLCDQKKAPSIQEIRDYERGSYGGYEEAYAEVPVNYGIHF